MMILITGVLGTIVLFVLALGSNFMIFLVRRDPELIPNGYITLLYAIVMLMIFSLIIFWLIIPLNNKFHFFPKLGKKNIESPTGKKISSLIKIERARDTDKKSHKRINLNFFSKIKRKKMQTLSAEQIEITKSANMLTKKPSYSRPIISGAVNKTIMPSKAELLRASMMALDKGENELAREFIKHAKIAK
jgi:hypothetical protein